jgi:hypothetical protein
VLRLLLHLLNMSLLNSCSSVAALLQSVAALLQRHAATKYVATK